MDYLVYTILLLAIAQYGQGKPNFVIMFMDDVSCYKLWKPVLIINYQLIIKITKYFCIKLV